MKVTNSIVGLTGFRKLNNTGENFLTESGVYKLIFKSRKPDAEKFQDWVTDEVLPTIRKTGSFQVSNQVIPLTPKQLVAADLRALLDITNMFEIPKHMAQIEVVKDIRKEHGLDLSNYLRLAPAQDNIKPEEVMLEPTELGKHFGISAKAMNLQLAGLNLQHKIETGWLPTEEGERVCMKHSWVKGGKSGYNFKWSLAAVKELLAA